MPALSHVALAADAVPVAVQPESTDSRLKVRGRDLERELSRHPEARLFLLNNPCNPTAQLYDEAEVEDLLSVCVRHRIYFVLDRLYWRIVFDAPSYPEPRVDEETRPWLVQVDGISKNFRRTGGIRIGWSVAAEDLAAAMTNLQSHYTSGPSIPAQYAALAATSVVLDDEDDLDAALASLRAAREEIAAKRRARK